ncbi:hypothetical protein ACFLRW_04230 [Acidobacteriota bacterium]
MTEEKITEKMRTEGIQRLEKAVAKLAEFLKKTADESKLQDEIRRLEKEFDVTLDVTTIKKRPKKRKVRSGKISLPPKQTSYESEVLSPHGFIERTMTESFDIDIDEKVVTFSKKTGDYLEEFTFLKKGTEYKNKSNIPDPKDMKGDLRASMKLLLEKRTNPFDFTSKEKLIAHDLPKDKLKWTGGRDYEQVIVPFIHLATMIYSKSKIGKDGQEKLLRLKHLSPYEEIHLPENKGDKFGVLIRASYLRNLEIETGESEPGEFKQLPLINPYQGQFVEEKAYEWLESEVQGRSLKIEVSTILKNRLRMQSQDYQRKNICLEYIDRWLKVAKEEGYYFIIEPGNEDIPDNIVNLLQDYDIDRITKQYALGDCRQWKIQFDSPLKVEYELTDFGRILAEAMIGYFYDDNNFGIENPIKKTRMFFHYFIRKLGEEKVQEIFEDVKKNKDTNKAALLFDTMKQAVQTLKLTMEKQ